MCPCSVSPSQQKKYLFWQSTIRISVFSCFCIACVAWRLGLKKVTKEQQTHKNPELRASSVVKASGKPTATTSSAKKPAATTVQHKPLIELQGKKWIVVSTWMKALQFCMRCTLGGMMGVVCIVSRFSTGFFGRRFASWPGSDKRHSPFRLGRGIVVNKWNNKVTVCSSWFWNEFRGKLLN